LEYGLSLGSNLGDRLAHLQSAREGIAKIPGVERVEQADVYETAPVGVRPEYAALTYLNTVLIVSATTSPNAMSAAIHAIETEMGRIRTEDRFAPRPIDIDILYAGDELSEDDALTLPHPRWAERRFVVQPLADVRPDMRFPGDLRTVSDVLNALPTEPVVTRFTSAW